MVKVKLQEWCDRWSSGNIDDKDYFSIAGNEEKETTDAVYAEAMGRLIKTGGEPDAKKSKK